MSSSNKVIVLFGICFTVLTFGIMLNYMGKMDSQMASFKRAVTIELNNYKVYFEVEKKRKLAELPHVDIPLPKEVVGPEEELERMWNYVYTMQYKCTTSKYLGGRPKEFMDGAYDLCVEPQFWERAQNPGYTCLMYSFGVGYDFSFDDEMARLGCEVHSFDPSMHYEDGMVRKSGVIFHKIGISTVDIEKDSNGWKMRTLKTLLKELGHSGKYLDYLKVDTDAPEGGFEDAIMQELLDTGLHQCVRQYAMEIHIAGPLNMPKKLERMRKIHKQMTDLNSHGWRLYNTTDNVRSMLKHNPNANQLMNKKTIVKDQRMIFWETAFVNLEVKGPCSV
uniref:Methyltransferase domain-containing protein n=2 Tax=Ciona savignyi TaxID=51511 RepID=H2ZE30_CIOSA